MFRYIQFLLLFCILFSCTKKEKVRILVFSKTTGFRHESIKEGQLALVKLGHENDFEVDTTEDVTKFTEPVLKQYSAVVFLQATGDLFNQKQKSELKRYIQSGGGFVGIHAAADAEHNWPWYKRLVGAEFASHPAVQKAKLKILDRNHPSTKKLPDVWERSDEWYNFKTLNPNVKVLISIDESSYTGGTMGAHHPMAWYHEFDGGRSFYTELGHTKESFKEPLLLNHILGGIQYAIGDNKRNYAFASPEEDRFIKTVLAERLTEPMKLAIAKNGQVFFIQRTGEILEYLPDSGKINKIGELNVFENNEDGLLGMALDPHFTHTHWIYFFYSPFGDTSQQYISRFTLTDGKIDMQSEKVILKIPTQRIYCCHSAGSIAFDKYGDLFISAGDNTLPSEYGALDEREGMSYMDAQTTAANTNDLRGKILRIHPESDGSYTIPHGNLFSEHTEKTKPEIYAMGLRNPFRISVDPHTSDVYWGEVGPDAGVDSSRGPMGYDEINVATKPGFFGWPYFVADNKPYADFNFSTKELGPFFNPDKPVNNSPNNTGLLNLPPAQNPLIWYSNTESELFENVGRGGRSAMAGPFYYYNDYKDSPYKFPKYYNGDVLFYDWMRGWVAAVKLDKNKKIVRNQRLFGNMSFEHPIDIAFAPDGSMYFLEYGTRWHAQNDNARLLRITYDKSNRPPVAVIEASDSVGPLPLKIKFSGKKSYDPDLYVKNFAYEWRIDGGKIQSREEAPVFTFTKPGIFTTSLTVTDDEGKSTTSFLKITAGNHFPVLRWEVMGNKTFFWPGNPVQYNVHIEDVEDKTIDPLKVNVFVNYSVGDKEKKAGSDSKKIEIDHPLINDSDCKACHTMNERSVGPSFMEVSRKYKNDITAVEKLSDKIIKGGNGVWGEHLMSPHPQIPKNDAKQMVKYILSLDRDPSVKIKLKPNGAFTPEAEPVFHSRYYFTATYKDKGVPGMGGFTGRADFALRSPKIEACKFDTNFSTGQIPDKNQNYFYESFATKSWIGYKMVDLKGISEIQITANSNDAVGNIEIHLDSAGGALIGKCPIIPTGKWEDWKSSSTKINQEGIHDLYFVMVCTPGKYVNVKEIYFKNFPLSLGKR